MSGVVALAGFAGFAGAVAHAASSGSSSSAFPNKGLGAHLAKRGPTFEVSVTERAEPQSIPTVKAIMALSPLSRQKAALPVTPRDFRTRQAANSGDAPAAMTSSPRSTS